MHRKLPFVLCSLALTLLVGCGTTQGHNVPASPSPTLSGEATATPEPTPAPTPTPTPEPTPTPTPEPTPEPVEPYEFGTPLEESEPVADDSFFDSAAFLGDSRTEGLQLFGGIKNGDYLWARGMTVFGVDSSTHPVNGSSGGMLETLGQKEYDSVYILLGLNELGYNSGNYERGLGTMIDRVLEIQPEAVIYLQLMPPVNNAACRANGLGRYITNENVTLFNEAITRVAADKKVALLNIAEAYAGEDGQLPAELSADGCHFAAGAYGRWADYLRTHTIDRERYFANREAALAEQAPAEQAPEQ